MVGVPGNQQETSKKNYSGVFASIPILTILEFDPCSFIVLIKLSIQTKAQLISSCQVVYCQVVREVGCYLISKWSLD